MFSNHLTPLHYLIHKYIRLCVCVIYICDRPICLVARPYGFDFYDNGFKPYTEWQTFSVMINQQNAVPLTYNFVNKKSDGCRE